MGLEDFYNGRSGGIEGLEDTFDGRLRVMFGAMPENVAAYVSINSAYRSEQHQQELWEKAIKKYGSEQAARKWVAPPGRSNHNHGRAMDIKFTSDVARQWFHNNAARFGLAFPMKHEPWHIEPFGLRDGTYQPGHHDGDGHGHYVQGAEDAYTDNVEVDNFSIDTQLTRVADLMKGTAGYNNPNKVKPQDVRGRIDYNINRSTQEFT